MIITTNMMSITSINSLHRNQTFMSKALKKLSTGMRINQAADDAAGLAISEKMRGQIRGLNQARRNVADGISLLQTAESGIGSIQEVLQRMRELCVQGANDVLTDNDRRNIQLELDQLKANIRKISSNTEFNGMKLLDGSKSGGPYIQSSSVTPNLSIPTDGTTAGANLTVEGRNIDFQFTRTAPGTVEITAKYGSEVLGQATFSASPNIEWQKALGGTSVDQAESILQTADGGYVLIGNTTSIDGDIDADPGSMNNSWVAKLDAAGEIMWKKTLGGNEGDLAYNIQQTGDGGYILAGTTECNDEDPPLRMICG